MPGKVHNGIGFLASGPFPTSQGQWKSAGKPDALQTLRGPGARLRRLSVVGLNLWGICL